MGCSTSKLDNEEAVLLCKDRKKFIKEALEERIRFASAHIAYIQSLKLVSTALHNYIEGDEPREFFLDLFSTPPFTPVKKTCRSDISISSIPFSTPPPSQSESNSALKVNYLRSGENPLAISVEERPPQSPETVRINSYSSPMHYFGIDGFFAMQSSSLNSSYLSSSLNRPSFPQTSQWGDFFWNPFSSLDTYGYPTHISLEQTLMDDETPGLRQVFEEEGIPDLEEEVEEQDEQVVKTEARAPKIDMNCANYLADDEVIIEEDEEDTGTDSSEIDTMHEVKGLKSHGAESIEVSEAQNTVELEFSDQDRAESDRKDKEPPGFTVYVNRRPTSMAEVIKDLETQFMIVCNSANEVSTILEASKAHQYSSTSNELTAMRMLNPVALFHSASSRSSSSRFLNNSSSSRDDGYESSSDFSESRMFLGSHQSTLDRLYVWEKKLYEEVKSGERVHIAYEKKYMQLKDQDVKGEDPCVVYKTRAAIRDLQTQIKVSIHSIEAVSKRIETLVVEELQPQLLELIQGLAKMWKVIAECHEIQKQTIDKAKLLLLAATPQKLEVAEQKLGEMSPTEPHQLFRSAINLETELRNWRTCFESWMAAQRSYVQALTGWFLRCMRTDPETSKLPFSPTHSGEGGAAAPPIFGICIQWSRFLADISDDPVIDALDFFAAGVGSLYTKKADDSFPTPMGSKRFSSVSGGNMEMVEVDHQVEEEVMMSVEKMGQVATRVLCAGMSVAMSSLMKFARSSAEGYADLVKQWENGTWTQETNKAVM